MYNMRRELARRLDLLFEELDDEEQGRIDKLIADLEMLKRTDLEVGPMPGGVDPVSHYLGKMESGVLSIRNYLRQPKPDPEILRRREQEFQANYQKNVEQLVPLLPKKIVASVNKNGVDIVQPNGTVDVIYNNKIANHPEEARKTIDNVLQMVKNGDYAPLVREIEWLKSVGFMPSKSNELARWRFKFPSVNAELYAAVLNKDGTASYRLKFSSNLKAVINRTEITLGDWTHEQIEELVDTLATVVYSVQNLYDRVHRDSPPHDPTSYSDKRLVSMELQIDNIGDMQILYRVTITLRRSFDRHTGDNPNTVVEISSNSVTSAKSVRDRLLAGLRELMPDRRMVPVSGEVV